MPAMLPEKYLILIVIWLDITELLEVRNTLFMHLHIFTYCESDISKLIYDYLALSWYLHTRRSWHSTKGRGVLLLFSLQNFVIYRDFIFFYNFWYFTTITGIFSCYVNVRSLYFILNNTFKLANLKYFNNSSNALQYVIKLVHTTH